MAIRKDKSFTGVQQSLEDEISVII